MRVRVRDFIARKMVSAVLSRRHAQFLNRILLSMAMRGMGVDNHDDAQYDERLLLRKRRTTLPDMPIVFDVGANVGQYASIVADEIPRARLYSFEPNPAAFKRLIASVQRSDFYPFNLAMGSTPGTSVMFDHQEGEGTYHGSLIKGVIETIHHDQAREISITVTTIDSIMVELNIERIHLLKIDVEGFEAEVLRGAVDAIRNKKIDILQFEFGDMNTVSRVFVQDFIDLLPGYTLHRLLANGDLLEIQREGALRREFFGYQNIVALPLP